MRGLWMMITIGFIEDDRIMITTGWIMEDDQASRMIHGTDEGYKGKGNGYKKEALGCLGR